MKDVSGIFLFQNYALITVCQKIKNIKNKK